MYSMMNEIKELLTEGGTKVFTKYAVEIGDALWSALYRYIETTYPDGENSWCSKYSIDGVFEENGQKFAILQDRTDMKYYRLNFSLSEAEGFTAEESLINVTKTYQPAAEAQFASAEVEAYVAEYVKKKEEENKGKTDEEDKKESENSSEEDEKSEGSNDDSESEKEDDDEEDKKKKKYSFDSLEEIEEYTTLQKDFSNLEDKIAQLNNTIESLNSELTSLREFKLEAERAKKEAKIAEFYMLSDEDKKDIVENIDKYSLDDIEAKLSVICFRNKVSFTSKTDDDPQDPTVYHLEGDEGNDSSTPAWVKAALDTAKTLN